MTTFKDEFEGPTQYTLGEIHTTLEKCDPKLICYKVNQLITSHNGNYPDSMATFSEEQIASYLQNGDVVYATNGWGNCIGFAKLHNWGEVDGSQILEFGSWIVDPLFQGLGVGKKILEASLSLAKTKYPNCKIYAIVANSDSSDSKQIFEGKYKLEPQSGRPLGIESLIETPVVHYDITDLDYST